MSFRSSIQHANRSVSMSRLKEFLSQCETFNERFYVNEFFGFVGDAAIVQVQPKAGQRGGIPKSVGLVAKVFDANRYAEAGQQKVDLECQNSVEVSRAGHSNLVNSYEQCDLTLNSLPTKALIQERCYCSLKAYLKSRSSKLQPAELLHLVKGVFSGVMHLHENGWVHRSLVSSNIMLHSLDEASSLLKMTPKVDNFRSLYKVTEQRANQEPLIETRIEFRPTPTLEKNADQDFSLHDIPAYEVDVRALGILIDHLYTITEECPPAIKKLAQSMSIGAIGIRAALKTLVSTLQPDKDKLPKEIKNGRYELLEELGRGGCGIVGKYMDRQLKIEVAIKLVLNQHNPRLKGLLEPEALRMAKSLEHNGFARILDYVQLDESQETESHAIVMQYINGPSLRRAQSRLQKFPLEERTRMAVKWIEQIGNAVGYLHQKGLVHRDLTPGNILIDPNNDALIIDFGLACNRFTPVEEELANAGTFEYFSPERAQARLDKNRSYTSKPTDDIYAIGAIFFELLTGNRLFETKKDIKDIAEKEQDLLRRIARNDHSVKARLEAFGVSVNLANLIDDCVAEDSKRRPASGSDLVARFAELKTLTDQRPRQNHFTGQWISIGAILLAFAAILWFATATWNSGKPTPATQENKDITTSNVNWYRGQLPRVKAFDNHAVVINAGKFHGIAPETIFGVLGTSLREIPKSGSFLGYVKVNDVEPFASTATPVSYAGLGIPNKIPINAELVPIEFPERQPIARLFISSTDNSGRPLPEKILAEIRSDLQGTNSKMIHFVDTAALANWQIQRVSAESLELRLFPLKTRSAVSAISDYSFFKAMRPLEMEEAWADDFIETFEHLIRVNEFIELALRSAATSPIRESEIAIALKVNEESVLEPGHKRHKVSKGQKLKLTVSNKKDQPSQLRIVELTPQLTRDRFFPLQPAEIESSGRIPAKESIDIEFAFSTLGETELIFIACSVDELIDHELLFDDGNDFVNRLANRRSSNSPPTDHFLVDVNRLFGGVTQRSSRERSTSSAAVGLLLLEIIDESETH